MSTETYAKLSKPTEHAHNSVVCWPPCGRTLPVLFTIKGLFLVQDKEKADSLFAAVNAHSQATTKVRLVVQHVCNMNMFGSW